MDYFKGRGHLTRAGDVSSLIAWINASIIQGSGVGPPSYVVEASDLHPRNSQNAITKFADDTYLLVGSTSIGTINEEFNNIEQWADNNNMKVHPSKTKELIVSRPRSKPKIDPLRPFIDGAERVSTLKVLGVVLDSRLTMSEHVSRVLSACASSTFALRLLRTHGLGSDQLHLVARATTVGSIMYASPAWWGFAGIGDRQRFERLLARLRRCGFLPCDFPSIETLANEADRKLLKSISQCPSHVLRHLLIEKPTSGRSLRPRAHNFILPPKDNRNFLSRALYQAICPPSG